MKAPTIARTLVSLFVLTFVSACASAPESALLEDKAPEATDTSPSSQTEPVEIEPPPVEIATDVPAEPPAAEEEPEPEEPSAPAVAQEEAAPESPTAEEPAADAEPEPVSPPELGTVPIAKPPVPEIAAVPEGPFIDVVPPPRNPSPLPPIVPAEPEVPPVDILDQPGPEATFNAIGALVEAGDPMAAIARLEEAEAGDASETEVSLLYADLLVTAGMFDEAASVYDEVLSADAGNVEAAAGRALLAIAMREANDPTRREYVTYLKEIAPDDPRANTILGQDALDRNAADEAVEFFETAADSDPENFVAQMGLGTALMYTGKPEEAIEPLSAAIEIEPEYPYSYVDRGKARAESGDYRGAEEDLSSAIDIEPENFWHYFDRGRLRARSGSFAEAEADFDTAIALDPGIFLTYVYRARVRDLQNEIGGAIDDYRVALSLRPDYYPAYAPVATLLYKAEEYEAAAAYFNEAYEAEDTASFSLVLLAFLSYSYAEQPREARLYLESMVTRVERQSLYWEMARYYLNPGYDGYILQLVNRAEDELLKARMQFFLGAIYDFYGDTQTAVTLYDEMLEAGYASLPEHQIAQWKIDQLQR